MLRRDLLKSFAAFSAQPLCRKPATAKPSLSGILDDPTLMRFSVEEGHDRCDVWLNDKPVEMCVEFMGSPNHGVNILGAVRCIKRDRLGRICTKSGGLIYEWHIGMVRWKPLNSVKE